MLLPSYVGVPVVPVPPGKMRDRTRRTESAPAVTLIVTGLLLLVPRSVAESLKLNAIG